MRAFVAATLPEMALHEIAGIQDELKKHFPELRIESASKMHITLHFLGEIGENEASQFWFEFKSAFEEMKFPLSELSVNGIEYFPSKTMPRGLWLSCADDGTLARIANLIAMISERYGIQKELRDFKPHITLGRFKSGGMVKRTSSFDLHKLFGKGKFIMSNFYPQSIALYRSILRKTGSEYTRIFEISLESRSGSNG